MLQRLFGSGRLLWFFVFDYISYSNHPGHKFAVPYGFFSTQTWGRKYDIVSPGVRYTCRAAFKSRSALRLISLRVLLARFLMTPVGRTRTTVFVGAICVSGGIAWVLSMAPVMNAIPNLI